MPKGYIQLGACGSSPRICPARATGCPSGFWEWGVFTFPKPFWLRVPIETLHKRFNSGHLLFVSTQNTIVSSDNTTIHKRRTVNISPVISRCHIRPPPKHNLFQISHCTPNTPRLSKFRNKLLCVWPDLTHQTVGCSKPCFTHWPTDLAVSILELLELKPLHQADLDHYLGPYKQPGLQWTV